MMLHNKLRESENPVVAATKAVSFDAHKLRDQLESSSQLLVEV